MPPEISKETEERIIFFEDYPLDQPRTSPCESDCPAGLPIQKVISLLTNNRFEEAFEYIKAKNPLAGITGRVCPHTCMSQCNRSSFDEGISIRSLERAVFDYANVDKVNKVLKLPKTGKKVSVIGSGPAGMTAAYFLILLGHDVSIIEALNEIGGMPKAAMPAYRLPMDVVDKQTSEVIGLGIKVITNTRVGTDISFEDIRKECDACLVATGAWQDMELRLSGHELAVSGLSFLSQCRLGKAPPVGNRVVVIGGGNVAFDCARTALRLGSKDVSIVCLEGKEEMVASAEEIEQAASEGITLHNSKTCTRILCNNGGATGIECRNVKSFRFDEEGLVHIDSVSGSEVILGADTVISATGQLPDLGFAAGISGFQVTSRHTLEVDPLTLATGMEGIFAAGDVVTGSKSVAAAVGSGRRAAISIHSYLSRENGKFIDSVVVDEGGNILIKRNGFKKKRAIPQRIVTYDELHHLDYFERKPRVETRRLSSAESSQRFSEIDKGYTRWQAIEEASRCFHCGHCFQCGTCVDICPDDVYRSNGDGTLVAYPDDCCYCGCCVMDCPCSAITIRTPLPMRVSAFRVEQP